jgi:hypothetical protein
MKQHVWIEILNELSNAIMLMWCDANKLGTLEKASWRVNIEAFDFASPFRIFCHGGNKGTELTTHSGD